MNIVEDIFGSKAGKIVILVLFSLLVLLAMTPKMVAVFVNNGSDCKFETLTNKLSKEK